MAQKRKTVNRWWDFIVVLMLVVIITTAITRLIATDWTEGLNITRIIAYSGLVAGLALGYSVFSTRTVVFFTFVYGVFVILWQLGQLLGEGILWTERLLSLAGRLGVITGELFRQQAVSDNLLFLTFMAILFWGVSIFAGYSLTRFGNAWRVILPIGIILVIIHSYDALLGNRSWYLLVFLFFSFLLISRMAYLQQRDRWQESQTYTPPYIGVDFVRVTVVIITVLLLFSWVVPGVAETVPAAQDAWQYAKQPWNSVRSTFDNAFASLRSTVGIITDYYGPNLNLGRGNRMSDAHILSVLTPTDPPDGYRFYWRARVYDKYDDGWQSTFSDQDVIAPDQIDFIYPDIADDSTQTNTFSFTIGSSLATLLTTNQPIWVSRPARYEYEENSEGSVDIALIRAAPPLRTGETYTVRSSLNQVTINDLREAGTDYPEWVLDRYLQIPDSITPRTLDLAQEIAAGKDSPYDVTAAITQYLRNNIEYTETVPPLPADQELIDWFLFDVKQGFCNYYATSEIIMLRSLGIPARLSVGYAQGEPIEDVPDAYLVRQRDAHAWPEVYFPGIGWIEFEPTVSQPMLVRPLGYSLDLDRPQSIEDELRNPLGDVEADLTNRGGEEEGAGAIDTTTTLQRYGVVLLITALIIGFIILMIPLIRRKRLHEKIPHLPIYLETGIQRLGLKPPTMLQWWAQYARLNPIARAYSEINMSLNRLGRHPKPTDTPLERAGVLMQTLPVAIEPTQRLLTEYQATTYSNKYTPDLENAQQASIEIRSLSIKEMVHQWWQRATTFFGGKPRKVGRDSSSRT